MTETIQTAMDRLMTISAEPQDYVAEDGLLYCGSCKTPKEAFFPNGKKLFGRDRHPAEYRCRQATREKQEKEERARLHYEKVQRLKLQGFTDWAMQELPQDAVEHGLPQEERLKNLLDKVRNLYCYLDNGIIVKLNFAPRGSSTLSERIGRCFQSAS